LQCRVAPGTDTWWSVFVVIEVTFLLR
jgi:hypothetical protein